MGLFNAAAAAHPLLFVFAVGCGAALAGFFFALWSRRGRTSKQPGFQNSGSRVAKASERRDPVTGLVQREAFEAQFEHAAIACDHGGSAVALVEADGAEETGRGLHAAYRDATGLDAAWFLTAAGAGPSVAME